MFGSSDSGPFYKEDGPRFESYPGGMTWARGRGYTYVATGGLPGTKSEKNTLRAISDGLADSISSADMDNSVCVPLNTTRRLLPPSFFLPHQRLSHPAASAQQTREPGSIRLTSDAGGVRCAQTGARPRSLLAGLAAPVGDGP